MPRTSERGGPQTRTRISDIATRLFLDRGFDAVTVADVAREAGVSSVTVFNHFPRKEDLLFDKTDEAVAILEQAVSERSPGSDALAGLRAAAFRLVEDGHPLSGVDDRSMPFFRTVAQSPALVARTREIAAELRAALAGALAGDDGFTGDPELFSALVVSGYATVLVENARRLIAGESPAEVRLDLDERLARLFDALSGLSGS